MLTALGRVSVTPVQVIYPSFHAALGGLVQLGSPCSALREHEFPEVKPGKGSRHLRGRQGEKKLCFARRAGLCPALGSLKSPSPVTLLQTCDLWRCLVTHIDVRIGDEDLSCGLLLNWHKLRVVPGNVKMICASRGILLESGERAQKLLQWGG